MSSRPVKLHIEVRVGHILDTTDTPAMMIYATIVPRVGEILNLDGFPIIGWFLPPGTPKPSGLHIVNHVRWDSPDSPILFVSQFFIL